MSGSWWLMQGDTRIGEFRHCATDQSTFPCRFTPGPGWEAVRTRFEDWAALHGVVFKPDDAARTRWRSAGAPHLAEERAEPVAA